MKIISKYMLTAGVMILAVSCGSDKSDSENDVDSTSNVVVDNSAELSQAIADRDSIMSIMSEISVGLAQIKELENIITVNSGEMPNRRAEMLRDIKAIQARIAERQAKLAELEQKLNNANSNTETLKKSIETLRAQIAEQEESIAQLTAQLGVANETIAVQTAKIDTLNTTVKSVSNELAQSQENNIKLTNEMNVCYYAIGSAKNLKEHKILEKKFLRSTKIMKGEFDQSYFTKADKRTLSVIPLYAKKAEVKTNQPKDSYELRTTGNGQLELAILKPAEFWKLTDYLVIETK